MNSEVRTPTGTRVDQQSHPSITGGKAYSQDMREMILEERFLLGFPHSNREIAGKWPSKQTCSRWISQYNDVNHVLAKRRTGNHRKEREIIGIPLTRLALYRIVQPKATLAEVKAYLHNLNNTLDIYCDSQIYRAESSLGLTRLVGSTTADSALLPINLQKRQMYSGIADINPIDIIDIDERELYLETSNRKYGKVVRGRRCEQEGIYNRGERMNCLLAILGEDSNSANRWVETWTGEGMNLDRFYLYIERIVQDLQTQYPGRIFCFTMDNLNVHKNPLVTSLIRNAGHRLVFRAPYWSVDGSIEYVFNTIQTTLMVYFHELKTMADLENRTHQIVGSLGSFKPYFEHVGFKY